MLPRLASSADVQLYLPSVSEACSSRALYFSLVAMICHCVLGNRLEAHKIGHELHSSKPVDFSPIIAMLEQKAELHPLLDVVASLNRDVVPKDQLIDFSE